MWEKKWIVEKIQTQKMVGEKVRASVNNGRAAQAKEWRSTTGTNIDLQQQDPKQFGRRVVVDIVDQVGL
ncbi:hypothetical protein U1Q18_002621, partial [Sarracenia purpurea var. burkii]